MSIVDAKKSMNVCSMNVVVSHSGIFCQRFYEYCEIRHTTVIIYSLLTI